MAHPSRSPTSRARPSRQHLDLHFWSVNPINAAIVGLSSLRGQIWIYVESLPSSPNGSLTILGARSASPSRWIVQLKVQSNGCLELMTPSDRDSLISPTNSVRTGRWTQVAFVHYAQKSPASPMRMPLPSQVDFLAWPLTVYCIFLDLYVDGREVASRNGVYPKPSPPPTLYHFGSDSFSEDDISPRWSMA